MITELVNDLEDLKIGDVIVYSSGVGMRTAKIDRKPEKRSSTSAWYKPTRCKVNLTINTYPRNIWKNGAYVVHGTRTTKTQNFNVEEFNGVKYLTFSVPILRLVDV
jgi:hypothetical protein